MALAQSYDLVLEGTISASGASRYEARGDALIQNLQTSALSEITVAGEGSFSFSGGVAISGGFSLQSENLPPAPPVVTDEGQYRWTGFGTTNDWNNAANWLGGVVPPESADVVFANSGADCALNSSVQVRDLIVQSSYTGSLRLGAITLSVAGNYLISPPLGVVPSGSTILSFVGSENQQVLMTEFVAYPVVNNKNTSGTLCFLDSAYISFLNLQKNTTTEMKEGETLVLGKLYMKGYTVADSPILKSSSAVNSAFLNINSLSSIFTYPSFSGIDARAGLAVYANINGIDLGRNYNIFFPVVDGGSEGGNTIITPPITAKCYWTGLGATSDWNNVDNWSDGVLPPANSDVIFSASSADCSINTMLQIHNMLIEESYTGKLSLGAVTLAISGNYITHPALNVVADSASVLSFSGLGDQQIKISEAVTYPKIENKNIYGTVSFQTSASITYLSLQKSTKTQIQEACTLFLDKLYMKATSASLSPLLKSSSSLNPAFLAINGLSSSFAYPSFSGIDARSGLALYANIDGIDLGGNYNIFFPLASSGNTTGIPSVGTYYWTGLGSSSDWNDATNWQGGVVPPAEADIVFSDSNSDSDCVITDILQIHNLTIEESYTGTLNLGAVTLVVSGNYFIYSPWAVEPSSKTVLRFAGTTDQQVFLSDLVRYPKIENKKTSGKLSFQTSASSTFLSLSKSTQTEIHEGATLFLTKLSMLGSSVSESALLKSASSNQPAFLAIDGLYSSLSYPSFLNIDARSGLALYADINGIDLGGNYNIFFPVVAGGNTVVSPPASTTYHWTGLGSTSDWGDSGNWLEGAVPCANDDVLFSDSAADCSFTSNTQIRNFVVDATYTGNLNFGWMTLSVSGNCSISPASTLSMNRNFLLSFFGTADQQVSLNELVKYPSVESLKTSGTLSFLKSASIGTLNLKINTITQMNEGSTLFLDRLLMRSYTLVGSPLLKSSSFVNPAFLCMNGSSSIFKNASFLGIDARSGLQLDASADGIDLGGNHNILFPTPTVARVKMDYESGVAGPPIYTGLQPSAIKAVQQIKLGSSNAELEQLLNTMAANFPLYQLHLALRSFASTVEEGELRQLQTPNGSLKLSVKHVVADSELELRSFESLDRGLPISLASLTPAHTLVWGTLFPVSDKTLLPTGAVGSFFSFHMVADGNSRQKGEALLATASLPISVINSKEGLLLYRLTDLNVFELTKTEVRKDGAFWRFDIEAGYAYVLVDMQREKDQSAAVTLGLGDSASSNLNGNGGGGCLLR